MNNYDNIPEELRALNQWIVWRYEDAGSKPTKIPYCPSSGKLASVNDPDSWTDFSTAVRLSKEYSGIGFVFTADDHYCFIDLDDTSGDQIAQKRQIDIFREFDSYSEISPSGNGLHIIVKGTVPAGRRRSFIEIYSSQRYATFTGNVYNNKFVINERQALLTQLWEQMGSGPATHIYGGDQQEKYKDEDIVNQASNATNGEKYRTLYNGDWQSYYPSQSEADFALIDMLAFYTQNRDQIARIFRQSKLGQRTKANRSDYLQWMINKSFDRMLPPIDIEGFQNQLELKLAEGRKQIATTSPELPLAIEPIKALIISNKAPIIPPGLLGEIAQFIYAAAPRPVPEIALAAAIGLMAGICGRAYNISGTGLNQYVLLLADTGCHAKGTEILMYDGSIKLVEDIIIGDKLMGPDSKPRTVLNLARGNDQMIEIIPTKGNPFEVNIDHILHLYNTKTKERVNITVEEWMNETATFKHLHKLVRQLVEFNNFANLPLDPWFLGAMLGDGHFSGVPTLTSKDGCIREKAAAIVKSLGMNIGTYQVPGNQSFQDSYTGSSFGYNPLMQIIKNLGLAHTRSRDKFIPHIYKISSRKNRMAILAGLLDTDGSLTYSGTYDYISKSEQLASDVVFIARSLGYAAYVKECEKYAQNGSGGTYYRVSISGDTSELPIVLEYKKSKARLQKKNVLVTGFRIERKEFDDYYGFALDGDNLYLTGDFTIHHNTGKEAMASGIDKLMNAIRLQVPTSSTYIGPSEIASGQALIKHLNKTSQCFVSILGEFGLRLQSMSSQHANSAEVGLRRMLLDLYNKSGYGQVFRPAIYADRDKNIEGTMSPSFSILGESTPERFYGALNEEMISEGLLPRFMLIEYNGIRPPLSKIITNEPHFTLIEKFASLIANCETVVHTRKVINVQADDQAQKMLDQFDEYATNLINGSDKDVYRQLWNRAHIKALKISATIAVGVNMFAPLIISEYVDYAIKMVQSDIRALSIKFEAGMIGANSLEINQVNEAAKRIKEYLQRPWEDVKSYCPSCGDLHASKIVPYEYFNTRISTLAAFKKDKQGGTVALKRVVQTLIDTGKIEEITRTKHYVDKFKRGSKRAFIAKAELFD